MFEDRCGAPTPAGPCTLKKGHVCQNDHDGSVGPRFDELPRTHREAFREWQRDMSAIVVEGVEVPDV